MEGKLNGLAARVPVSNASMVYLVLNTEKDVTLEQVKDTLKEAADSKEYRDLLVPAHKGAVSKDMIGRHESAIYVEDQIQVIDNNVVVIPAFYDNEYGYTRRLTDLAKLAGSQLYQQQAQAS